MVGVHPALRGGDGWSVVRDRNDTSLDQLRRFCLQLRFERCRSRVAAALPAPGPPTAHLTFLVNN